MSMKSLLKFALNSPIRLLTRINKTVNETFRAGFVSTAISEGIYDLLKEGSTSSDKIAESLAIANHEALVAWLDLGVSLGELSKKADGYIISGALSLGVTDANNDTWQAFLQSRIEVIFNYITRTPSMLKQHRRFSFSDEYGELFARSSRTVEPILLDIIENIIPQRGSLKLLEVGCGSGTYLKYACDRNTQLQATGLEFQRNVAEFARKNIVDWKINDKVNVEVADIRQYPGESQFDIVTLYNLIYYFPADERIKILKILSSHLKSNGRLVITTLCKTNNPAIEAMNLWCTMTEGCGPLPERTILVELLKEVGLRNVRSERLMPGYFMFDAMKA